MGKLIMHRAPFRSGVKWRFETARFLVVFRIDRDRHYQYDGDDEDGETQRKLNSGDYVAFNSYVEVYCDGEIIGTDHLGGSVYDRDKAHEFWTAHRDPDPTNRNTLALKAQNHVICHYFPDMVRNACREARIHINQFPKMRR